MFIKHELELPAYKFNFPGFIIGFSINPEGFQRFRDLLLFDLSQRGPRFFNNSLINTWCLTNQVRAYR